MPAYSLDFWRSTFPLLDLWSTLTPAHRAACLNIPSTYVAHGVIPAGLPSAAREAFLEKNEKGLYRARQEFARFQKLVLRALGWSLEEGVDLTRYVQQMTTLDHRGALTGNPHRSAQAVTHDLEDRLYQGRLGQDVLASPTAEAFLVLVGGWQGGEARYDEAAHAGLRDWFRAKSAVERYSHPLVTETFRLPGIGLAPESILAHLLEYAVGILVVDPRTLQPLIHLPRPEAKSSRGPEQLVLEPFAGTQSFARPFLLDDMAAYLRAAKAHPVPLLSDGVNAPIAHHRKVAKTLLTLPFEVPLPGWEGERRAEAAWWMLMELRLVEEKEGGRKGFTAGPAKAAEAWLAATREKRLQAVLERYTAGENGGQWVHRLFSFLGDFAAHPFPYSALDQEVFLGMEQAVERLEQPVDMGAWFDSAVEKANPFLAALEGNAELAWRWRRWDSTPQDVYGRLLSYHVARLCSLGALDLRSDAEGRLGLVLTEVGRWLYDKAETWSLPAAEKAIAVVGGDFTVTLLEASLELEAELAAFAEPVSGAGGAGAAYRLTRKSVQKAAHGGFGAEKMIAVLAAWSKHALPANVVHEVKAWAGARKTFKVREAVLVEGDDPLAVAELLASAPKDFERVSPTVLAYTGKAKPSALMQRLAKKGFLFG